MKRKAIRMKWSSAILCGVVVVTLCVCGGEDSGTMSFLPLPPAIPGPETGIPGIDSIRTEFLDAVNQARSVERICGTTPSPAVPPIAWNDNLAMAAYLHSEDMALNGFLDHTGSDGSSPGDRITRQGYVWWVYGENIAVDYRTVSDVMGGWLGSEGHCRNIMNPAFREIGAAYAEGPSLGTSATWYWTLDLAAAD